MPGVDGVADVGAQGVLVDLERRSVRASLPGEWTPLDVRALRREWVGLFGTFAPHVPGVERLGIAVGFPSGNGGLAMLPSLDFGDRHLWGVRTVRETGERGEDAI